MECKREYSVECRMRMEVVYYYVRIRQLGMK